VATEKFEVGGGEVVGLNAIDALRSCLVAGAIRQSIYTCRLKHSV
jgi:hypothetical protein